jgi:hypothetical protein
MNDPLNAHRANAAYRTFRKGIVWPTLFTSVAFMTLVAMSVVSPKTPVRDTTLAMVVIYYVRIICICTMHTAFSSHPYQTRGTPVENVTKARRRGRLGVAAAIFVLLCDIVVPVLGYVFAVLYLQNDSFTVVERIMPILSMSTMMLGRYMHEMLLLDVYGVVDSDDFLIAADMA